MGDEAERVPDPGMSRRHTTAGGTDDHPAEQSEPVVYVRYRQPEDGEWEEACLQFQGCKSLLEKVRQDLEKHGHDCHRSADCLYTKAERVSIVRALRKAGFDPAHVVDVDVPVPVPETDEGV